LKTFGRTEEAEALYQKLASRKITDPVFASAANSLAFSILMPQKRFVEAEDVLMRAISTSILREKINAYSNLAMVAYHLKEYKAAMRYATVGLTSHLVAIASESRLTICKIQNQKLRENPNSTESEWNTFFDLVLQNIQITDFDDAADFFEYLIGSCERSSHRKDLVQIVDEQYEILRAHSDWSYKKEVSAKIEALRVDKFSEVYLLEKRYPEIEELFTHSIEHLKDHRSSALIEYLKIPFAGVEFRRKCLAISDLVFIENWAGFEENSEILLKLSEHKVEDILISLAGNPAATDEVLMIIASEEDVDLDFAISTREKLSPEMIKLLMNSNFEPVRREIARRPDLDDSSYNKLATDVAALVRDAIRQNPACSQEIKALAALGSL
jgi:tetratricopeptide (TPR) repeat protein